MIESGFRALRSVKTATQRLAAPPERVFPLLCPRREYEWIESWQCRIVHSVSGFAELDCVFVTDFPGEGEDVWVVSVYRPDAEIEFVRVNRLRTIRYRIALTDGGDGTTLAHWTQTLTGLCEEGNCAVANLTDDVYCQRIALIEKRLNHFLSTGTMLRTQSQPE